jgi:hypothetical protein
MPATTGRYATYSAGALASRINHRWRRLLRTVVRIAGRGRLDERDNGAGYTLHREWGHWTLRPVTGWRALRWITPAPHTTRTIPRHDRDAASDWGMKTLDVG